MRLGLAFQAFFRILRDAAFADRVRRLAEPADGDGRAGPGRSSALSLLAALQREARFVDFLQEGLDGYSDAQVGAAARDVHRGCGAVVGRVFGLEPLRAEHEDAEIAVPAGFDPSRLRLTGDIAGPPPYRAVLRHAGWRATRCEVPEWTGAEEAALVVAPAEVEVK